MGNNRQSFSVWIEIIRAIATAVISVVSALTAVSCC